MSVLKKFKGDNRNNDDSLTPFLDFSHGGSYERPERFKPVSDYGVSESHQYEQEESEIWWHHQLQRHYQDVGQWWTFARKSDFLRWCLTLITGFLCGLVAFLVTFLTKYLTSFKFRMFYYLLTKEHNESMSFGSAFMFLLICNLVFGLIACFMVYLEPLAAGSGIPEVKCFLNGLNIPRLVRIKTLLSKAVGIVFSCSSGLPVGKEGPMVHIGAVVAAGVSQGKSVTFGLDTSFSKYQDFRNDKEKRDFVACGAAAGVAAAFGAPIGGVLFSLEEGASFWSTKLTWRCFFCAMMTVFTLYVFNTAKSLFGHSDSTAMFSFGEFFSLQGEVSNYSVWELSLFLLVGCMGGLIGACFNAATEKIFNWRKRYATTKGLKMIEVLLVISLMTLVSVTLPMLWNKCSPLPVDMEGWSDEEKELVVQLVPLYCPKDHYNELASLYLTDSDTAIRQLFHFREIGDHNVSTFSSGTLFLFFFPYIFMACLTYGTAVPAGLFVPSLTSGAAFGRLIGHLLHNIDNARGTFADSGTYALMGAAAITSGIARMTISLTVMILEATGDMQYVLPLMLTVMSARFIGNIFTDGVYDIHIQNRNLDFLEEDEGISKLVDLHDLCVNEIMTPRPYYLYPIMKVGEVYDILKKAKHHCFPVVDDQDDHVLMGSIQRKSICTLIKKKIFISKMKIQKSFDEKNLDIKQFLDHDPLLPVPKCSTINEINHSDDIEMITINENTAMNPIQVKNPSLSKKEYSNSALSILISQIFPTISWEDLESIYPRYPDINDLILTDAERECYLDLRPYMDVSPFTINEHASVQRAYRMFRTLGLRHLLVTNRHNKILGIITRTDLIAAHMTTSTNDDGHHTFESNKIRNRKRAQKHRHFHHNLLPDDIHSPSTPNTAY